MHLPDCLPWTAVIFPFSRESHIHTSILHLRARVSLPHFLFSKPLISNAQGVRNDRKSENLHLIFLWHWLEWLHKTHKPGVLRSPALITLISLLLLKTLFPSGLSELESQRRGKVIFTVLLFPLPVPGNINKSVHPDNGSFQLWSITILIKGKEPRAVHQSSGALSSFLKLHFCRQQTI